MTGWRSSVLDPRLDTDEAVCPLTPAAPHRSGWVQAVSLHSLTILNSHFSSLVCPSLPLFPNWGKAWPQETGEKRRVHSNADSMIATFWRDTHFFCILRSVYMFLTAVHVWYRRRVWKWHSGGVCRGWGTVTKFPVRHFEVWHLCSCFQRFQFDPNSSSQSVAWPHIRGEHLWN